MKITDICKGIAKIFNNHLIQQEHARFDAHKNNDGCLCFILKGNNAIEALDKGRDTIEVLNFFDEFWISFKIKFFEREIEIDEGKVFDEQYYGETFLAIGKNYYQISLTLSVFHGEKEDKIKTHLFRAEWDTTSESDYNHPQPHWHIYLMLEDVKVDKKIAKTFKEYNKIDGKIDFSQQIVSNIATKPIKKFNLEKVHFAMNGHWTKFKNGHIHKISDDELLFMWLDGLLKHLKSQLEYIIKKT